MEVRRGDPRAPRIGLKRTKSLRFIGRKSRQIRTAKRDFQNEWGRKASGGELIFLPQHRRIRITSEPSPPGAELAADRTLHQNIKTQTRGDAESGQTAARSVAKMLNMQWSHSGRRQRYGRIVN